MRKILVLNFGSTSTKIAVYAEEEQLLFREFHHASDEMGDSSSLKATAATRKAMILNYLKEQRVDLSEMDAVVGRGGLIRPVKGGTYRISEKMIEDLAGCVYGYHPCNLGGILAAEIARDLDKPAFTVDPPALMNFRTWRVCPDTGTSPAGRSFMRSTPVPSQSDMPQSMAHTMKRCA